MTRVTTKGGALRLCRSARCLFDEAPPPSVPLSLCTRPLIVSAHKERSSTRMNKPTQIVNAQISDLTERKENATHPPRGSRSIIGTSPPQQKGALPSDGHFPHILTIAGVKKNSLVNRSDTQLHSRDFQKKQFQFIDVENFTSTSS